MTDRIQKVCTLDEIFREGGVLSEKRPGYIVRPGQVVMAKAVEESIKKSKTLMAEGPTGVGKSFAYLIPAMLDRIGSQSAARVVVATANIALQDQLFFKDIPALTAMIPGCSDLKAMLVKGRSNYICMDKIEDTERMIMHFEEVKQKKYGDKEDLDEAEENLLKRESEFTDTELQELLKWAAKTKTGDKNDLTKNYEKKWHLVSTTAEECIGNKCPFTNKCFTNRARGGIRSADILISNYHFLLYKSEIAEDAILICDEAHDLAGIARDIGGWEIHRGTLKRVRDFISTHLGLRKEGAELQHEQGQMFTILEELLAKAKSSTKRIRDWSEVGYDLSTILKALESAYNKVSTQVSKIVSHDTSLNTRRLRRMCTAIGNALQKFMDLRDLALSKSAVYWIEKDESSGWVKLKSAYVDVSKMLDDRLYSKANVVIMTSATMTSGGSFEFIRRETGLAPDGELIAPSPFDLKKQGIIVVPEDMPEAPKDRRDRNKMIEWQQKLGSYAVRLMQICGGRCLMLFTSWANLNAVYSMVLPVGMKHGINVLHQKDAPKIKLIERFKADETSVLMGVASFWQGIDVPGKALSGLFIDKIPFPVPNTPLNEALGEIVESEGGSPFFDLHLPKAIITLSQGVGRLIRTTSDKGIVVIADPRIINKGYGDTIIRSLPEFKKVKNFDKVTGFLDITPLEVA